MNEEECGWELQERVESCLHVGTDERCVEKAAETIYRLKEYLAVWKKEKKRVNSTDPSKESGRSSRLVKTSSPYHHSRNDSSVSFYEHESEKLVVQGQRTGQMRKKYDWSNAEEVIMHMMSLMKRLEEDRQSTVEKWIKERETVIKMRKILDEKAIERLTILPLLVQQEHERFMKDVHELKWHVSFEGRHLQLIRDEVKIVADTNKEFKDDLERTSELLMLLLDKFDTEDDTMAFIIKKQGETDMELKQSKRDWDGITETTHQARHHVDTENRKMTRAIEELRGKLSTSLEALTVLMKEKDELNKEMESLRSNIASITMDRNIKTGQLESLNITKTGIEKEVSILRDRRQRQEEEALHLLERNVALKKRKKDKIASLDCKETVILSEIQRLSRELKETRQQNDDTLCEADEMKEQTELCLKHFQDDIKSIGRARRELIKIDKQLQVILFETDSVRSEHRQIMEEYESEELMLGSVEDSLRTGVNTMKQDYQKEVKTKTTYQGKIQAEQADLEKMAVESEQSERKIRTKAKEIELRKKNSVNRSNLLENTHQTKYKDEANLRDKIKNAKEELERIETTLGGRLSSVTIEKTEINTAVTEKRKRVSVLTDKGKLLNEKIIDTTKSSNMILRMESDTMLAIEALEGEKEELQGKIKDEEIEEESWKAELNDITEFSCDSKEQYTQFLIERERYLKQLEQDEADAAEQNRSLAIQYENLLEEHINIKTSTLCILEHQLELEAALKDLGQLLALQTKLSSTMVSSYKHRSITGIKDLQRFKDEAYKSSKKVSNIQTGLEVVLSSITQFLNKIEKEQLALIETRSRHGNSSKVTTRDTPNTINNNTASSLFVNTVIDCKI